MARLQRTLSLGSVVLFGIAYMTPIIVLGTFGILAQSTAGMVPAAYLAALVAMFFTAMSYGRMAAAFPVAGSAYSYVRKAISPKLGFIAGWAVLLDYLFLPMAIWLIGAATIVSVAGWLVPLAKAAVSAAEAGFWVASSAQRISWPSSTASTRACSMPTTRPTSPSCRRPTTPT